MKTKFKLKYLLVILAILTCFIIFLVKTWNNGWEEMRKMDCAANIKQIMLSLCQYALDNNNNFPYKNGEQGLQMLWDQNYFNKDYPYSLCCPSVRPLKKFAIEYEYIGGYNLNSAGNIGIVMDKIGNHANYGNIGFVDGHVGCFEGEDWQRNANLDLKENKGSSLNSDSAVAKPE